MENLVLDLIKSSFISIIFWLLISILFFLVIREIVLWYFKINEAVDSLDRIANSLEIIASSDEEITIKKEPMAISPSTTEPIGTKSVVIEVLNKD